MRHSVYGRKLSRTKNERRRLLQGLARDLIRHGQLRTTLAKAKAVQPMVEKLVSRAKVASSGARQSVKNVLSDKAVEALLFVDAPTRFSSRSSGFTRIVKLGPRRGDASEEVMLQFVDERVVAEVVKSPEKGTKVDGKVKKKEVVEKKRRGRPKKAPFDS